ncbi:hypothetical protein GGX14DRAFT_553323 [Mycena pura]|uniref:Uncharacterized protein n=1 Tax=Mycena pura TaxID=153505 RepID=A0AAD6YU52_9AGAR|nr:hypothetical protein GGX14DRAFT_553323 [Mycena pura]
MSMRRPNCSHPARYPTSANIFKILPTIKPAVSSPQDVKLKKFRAANDRRIPLASSAPPFPSFCRSRAHERFRSQRQIFLQCPGSKFWDKLDAALATIRKAAGGNAKKLSRAFRKVLDNDFKAHGSSSSLPVDVPEASAASTFQGEVDELITGPVRQSSPEM